MPADPDLRQIDADFRRVLGEAYRPLCRWRDGLWFTSEGDSYGGDAPPEIEALLYAAAAQAWVKIRMECMFAPTGNIMRIRVAKLDDFESISAMHAAVLAWEAKR